jgi:hypothetical protein
MITPPRFRNGYVTLVTSPTRSIFCIHVPVRLQKYRYAPPKSKILQVLTNDLLRKGVIRPSKSPYPSPAF